MHLRDGVGHTVWHTSRGVILTLLNAGDSRKARGARLSQNLVDYIDYCTNSRHQHLSQSSRPSYFASDTHLYGYGVYLCSERQTSR